MVFLIGLILSTIFLLIALIHFNWGFGGRWGYDQSIPTNLYNEKIFNPKTLECFVVGFGLLFFVFIINIRINNIANPFPNWVVNTMMYIIAFIFILRSVGDFKYVGLFKKVKHSVFAKFDNKYYTPLCILISTLTIILIINTKSIS